MFNIYLAIYIVVAIAIITGGTYKLYGMNQGVSSLIFLIGSITIFIVYGIRWFGAKNSLLSNTPVSWPPTINTCPDYLVYYGRQLADGTVQDTCIDAIGVSKNGSLKVFPKDEKPTSEDYYFSLATKSSDPAGKTAELCQRAITFGLTWEGITNGESCISPDGSTAPNTSAGGATSASCPK